MPNKPEMKKGSKKRKEAIKRLTERIKQAEELTQIENLVSRNVGEFKLGKVNYRVRKPTPNERTEANEMRIKKYLELLKDDTYVTKEELIELYKNKKIDISKMERELLELQGKENVVLLKLAKLKEQKDIENLKSEIMLIREKQTTISTRKSDLLQYSMENMLFEYVNSYFCYLLLEKKNGDKWERVFKSYEDFMNNDNDELFTRSIYFLSLLMTTDMLSPK